MFVAIQPLPVTAGNSILPSGQTPCLNPLSNLFSHLNQNLFSGSDSGAFLNLQMRVIYLRKPQKTPKIAAINMVSAFLPCQRAALRNRGGITTVGYVGFPSNFPRLWRLVPVSWTSKARNNVSFRRVSSLGLLSGQRPWQ